jgi:uncharacterized protein YpiB (UPF0302 family)
MVKIAADIHIIISVVTKGNFISIMSFFHSHWQLKEKSKFYFLNYLNKLNKH